MAYTAPRTTAGFERIGNLHNINSVPHRYLLTPNTAFKKGDMVVLTNGKVAPAAAGATNVLGVMAETFTTTTNPSGTDTYGYVYDNPYDIFRCSFADHRDATATGGSSTTLVDTNLSTSSDDVWNGALLYIYEGAGLGDTRIVKDYTGTGDVLTVEKPFSATPDTTTKYILLGEAGAAGDVIAPGALGVDLKDANTIDANAANKDGDGPLAVLSIDPAALMMTVIIREHAYNN